MRFIVVKSRSRKYGYALQDTQAPPKPNQYVRQDNIAGWYKLKKDAQARADELNHVHGGKYERN